MSEIKTRILEKIWIDIRPPTARDIASELGVSGRSVNAHLLNLRKAGFISKSHCGYVLTVTGKERLGLPPIDAEMAAAVLRNVPPETAFHFYTGIDHPLSIFAKNLIDFCETIKSIDVRSIEFHMTRGDFQQWIRYLGDLELEKRLGLISVSSLGDDTLREKLYHTLRTRIADLHSWKDAVVKRSELMLRA
jgi:DNA-binding Lrp family transcriptional regulator